MDNIEAYVKWRSDITLDISPFNIVDNVVFCALSYTCFKDIVPVLPGASISIKEAIDNFFDKYSEEEIKLNGELALAKSDLMRLMANSKRYKDMRLSNYIDVLDEDKKSQFAAFHIEIDDKHSYIAIRGTDLSIIGWQEDFRMAHEVIAAQRYATNYLNRTLEKNRRYYVGGHSKGGNLAVYAASMCDPQIQSRIENVFDNDGPGFLPEYLESEQYKKIRDRIIRIVPEYCVIGMLLEHDLKPIVVGSNVDGVMQHDIMTWQVAGCDLNKKGKVSEKSQFLNRIVDDWLKDATKENREAFANDFFEALKASGAKDFKDLSKTGAGGLEDIILSLSTSKPKAKEAFGKLIKSFYRNSKRLEVKSLLKDKNLWMCLVLIVMGFIMIASPRYALWGIGRAIIIAVFLFMILKVYKLINTKEKVIVIKKTRFLLYLICEAFVIFLLLKQEMLVALMNILIGILLVYTAYQNTHIIIFDKNAGRAMKIYLAIEALLSFIIGAVTIVLFNENNPSRMLTLGTFFVIANVINIVVLLHKKMLQQNEKEAN
ncbi:Mbeg1-like protein [Lachnospira multipara]|uniref:Mbeg1-like protein n=1 Tax=Lachnospira multipara TaxID=28051 RepID=UPI0004E1AF7D|nr:Mbeg1-like protein [Lachnospira multipara]